MKQRQNTWHAVLLMIGLLVAGGLLVGCSEEGEDDEITMSEIEVEASAEDGVPEIDVPYVPTPQHVVDRMLELAEITEDDVVYDLGSGDGRIVITAAEEYGARGVGIEIDSQRVESARENAAEAGVEDLVEFRQGDLFEEDISEATIVTIYLLPSVNLELRPKLFDELAPGTRVVSHDFDMDDWEPETIETLGSDTILRWTIPEEVPDSLRE